MRLLIIEDEVKTAAYVKKGLTEQGFYVDVCCEGKEGLRYATSIKYDLIIVDIMLPELDGWAVVAELRKMGIHCPLLILTARAQVEDRVKGLELGADDYLIKPFSFSELLARVCCLLRRNQPLQADVLQIADLTIDLLQQKTMRNGIKINLTAKEFALLVLLARRKTELLTRTLIAEQIWGINFDSETNIIDVAIRRLRQKVDDPFKCKLIHTIRGVGYVLEER